MERYIAIDNVCAWPNLTRMPDGRIVAVIFNQPCHGRWEGDVECWESEGGRFWRRCGVAAPHEPDTNRMNVGAGLARNGDLIVISSGWGGESFRGYCLPCWVCRSEDGGRTWEQTEGFPPPEGHKHIIPFGKIVHLPDGALAAAGYAMKEEGGELSRGCFLLRSEDDGRTWGEHTLIAANRGEPEILCVDENRLIAATRGNGPGLIQFVSEDNGRAWREDQPLTGASEYPGHLLKLKDGRIVLAYGVRHGGDYGVSARVSDDGGRSWGRPMRIVDLEDAVDGGYPSSVEMHDGRVLTAYYAGNIPQHQRYHMGVAIWDIEELDRRNRPSAGSKRHGGSVKRQAKEHAGPAAKDGV